MSEKKESDGVKDSGAKANLSLRTIAEILFHRLRPVWVTALIVWIIFSGFRLGLLLARLDGLRDVGIEELRRCFFWGLRYDAMPIGYFLFPLAMMTALVSRNTYELRWFRRTVTIYATAIVTFIAIVEIVGAAFFLHYGLRLNWMALYYLQYPREILVFIYENYPVWLVVIIAAVLFYYGYRILSKLLWREKAIGKLGGVWRAAIAVALAALLVIACRGGTDHRPLQRGPAYMSYNNLVNQLTLNNFFTFASAVRMKIYENRKESGWYSFPERKKATEIASRMLIQEPHEVSLNFPHNALWRKTSSNSPPQHDYNVVIILMEGMSAEHVGALGYEPSCTPNLDRMCKEGIYFEKMYGVGARTSRGVMGVLCGHPDIGGETILKRRQASETFFTLPSVFKSRGYQTMFIYGGDPHFDNMEAFFKARGMDEFIGQDQIGEEKADVWGVPDEMIFDAAHRKFSQMADEKFFAVILTVSNHEPYNVPKGRTELEKDDILRKKEDRLNAKIRNAYRYADWALDDFFKKARQGRYFERTIFVLVADHGVRMDHRLILDAPGYRVPCLIYAPGIEPAIAPPRRIPTVCSQVDIPPTILSLLGGSYEHCFLGRNVLAVEKGDGFAFLHEDDRLGFVRGNRVLVLPPLSDPMLFSTINGEMDRIRTRLTDPKEVHYLQLQMLSYYRMARDLYLTSAYCSPQDFVPAPTLPNAFRKR